MPLTIIPQPRADYAGPSRADKHTLNSNATRGEYLSPDTFSPVNENGSFAFDRVLKRGKVLHRSKNKHSFKASWKPGYLVLRPNLLSLYKDEDEAQLRMAITLSDISTVAHVKAPKSKRPNVFGIFSPSKNYRVQAPSQAEADSWVDHIRRECAFEHTERESEYIPKQRIPVMDVEESAWEMSDHDGHGGDNLSSIPHNTASILRSNLLEVSGNDITSCSDLSDVPPRSVPYRSLGYLDRLDHNMQPLRTQVDRQPSLRRHASHHSDKESRNTNPERVVFNGYLFCLKNKKGVRQWNKYWVVLRAEKLALYKNDQEYSAIRIIPLDQVVDAADIDPISRSKVFCFQLITEGATYRFCAPDEEALDHWLGSLKSVLTRVHERPHYERPVRALPGSSVGTR